MLLREVQAQANMAQESFRVPVVDCNVQLGLMADDVTAQLLAIASGVSETISLTMWLRGPIEDPILC